MNKVYFKYRKPYEREVHHYEVEILQDFGDGTFFIRTKEKGEFKVSKAELIFK